MSLHPLQQSLIFLHGNLDGSREGQQCKGRYGSEAKWTYGTVNAKTKSEQKEFEWEKIEIDKLNEEDVKLLVASEFNNLTQKTKKMLAISSNMYIWQHLNDNADRLHKNPPGLMPRGLSTV